MSSPVCLQRVSIAYHGHVAVRDVTATFPGGAVTALVGPSGSGKTTLLTALNRVCDLVDGCRMTGAIRVGGLTVGADRCDRRALCRQVGMVFQRPTPFPLSVRENVALALREHGFADIPGRVERALRQAALWDEVAYRLDAPATALSGGQQQRLCFARALALEPEVLLLDEPCSSLDPLSSGAVEDVIVSLKGRYTVVLVTHDLAQARRIADHVALVWPRAGAGELIELSPVDRFFSAASHPLARAYAAGERVA